MKILDVLTDEKKWLKNKWNNLAGGYCLMGALAQTDQHYGVAHEALREAIVTLYPGRGDSCVSFNNHPDTTFDDIKRVCKFADV